MVNNQNNNYNQNNNRNYNGQYNNMNGQYYNNQYPQNYNNNPYYNNGQYNNNNGQNYSNQYPQNRNFGQPVNNNQKPKEKKPDKEKKKFTLSKNMIIIIAAVLALIAIVTVIIIKNNSSKEPEEIVEADTRVVGNKTLGYVTIPIDWLKFKDVENVRGLQYSDKDGEYILTLDAVVTSSLDARGFIDQKKTELESVGITTEETVKSIGGYNAYQISGFYEEKNLWLMVWCFEAEDGYTHYIGIEGTDKENEAFKIAETFKLKETTEEEK